MGAKLLRDALLVSAVFVAGLVAFLNRELVYDFVGVHPSDIAAARAKRLAETNTLKEETSHMTIEGTATAISKARDGQFWVDARVNNSSIKFLVDTGASIVALTPLDAQKAGIALGNLQYTVPINTAAGQIMAASTRLSLISVGNVTVYNVRAVIIPKGLSHSLLGMSYLGELQRVEASKNLLILRQ